LRRLQSHGGTVTIHQHAVAAIWDTLTTGSANRITGNDRVRVSGSMPRKVRVGIKKALDKTVPALDIGRQYTANEETFKAVQARLFSDPDWYLRFLRFG
jgi:hypothetical protein